MWPPARSGANKAQRYDDGGRSRRGACGEIFLRPVRASAVQAIRLLVIDPLHFEASCNPSHEVSFVGVDDCSLGDAGLDP